MIKHYTIHIPQTSDENETVVHITDPKERDRIKQRIIQADASYNAQIANFPDTNSYDNDDYLFMADMIQDIRQLHQRMYCPMFIGKWIRGHSEIPGIHLYFTSETGTMFDPFGIETPHDELLNMGIKEKAESGYHKLWVDYPWLKRYLIFLQKIFDDNEELVFSFDQSDAIPSFEKTTRNKLLEIANNIESHSSVVADQLRFYAFGAIDQEYIPMPILVQQTNHQGTQILGLAYPNAQGKMSIPLKKSIFCTPGFAQFFCTRIELISDLFAASLKMVIAHEVAHVARGHWNLRDNEPAYSMVRNVAMNCELNADWTAAYWLITEPLYETLDGHPDTRILAITRERLIYLWSIRIFACYLVMSWRIRGDERTWSPRSLSEFISNPKLHHPIYEFRLFNMIGKFCELLENMAIMSEDEDHFLFTADGKRIDPDLIQDVWKRAEEMVYSFEYAFSSSFGNDSRNLPDKLHDSLLINNTDPNKPEKIPFYLCFMQQAQEEFKRYEEAWPEILEKLRKYGMYYLM